jgi:hypothetical protein
MYDPFSGEFDPVRDAETSYRATIDPAQREILKRMAEGVRETSELSDSPKRYRVLGRLERAGLIARFRVDGRHVAGLTEAGEALVREIFPKPPKAKRASKSKGNS